TSAVAAAPKQCKLARPAPAPASEAAPVEAPAAFVPAVAPPEAVEAPEVTAGPETAVPTLSEEAAPAEQAPTTVPAIFKFEFKESKSEQTGFQKASNGRRKGGQDWYSQGMEYHHGEEYDKAIEAFKKAIDAGEREEAATYNIACGYALKGDADQAFAWLNKAVAVGFDVGDYMLRDDDLDSLHSDPRWAELKKIARSGKSAQREREARAVANRYDRIAAKNPKSGEAFFDIGKELLNAERYDLAAKAYQAAIERGYRTGTALYNRACALSLAGDKRGALDMLAQSLDAGFDQPDIFRTDDDLDNVRGEPRFKELQREARDLSLPPYNNGWWNRHGRSRAERAKWRDAAVRFEDYAHKNPSKGRAWYNLGFASLAGDRPEAAIEAFQKALELGYRKPTTMYNLACTYARLDQKDPAFDWLFKALDAGFDSPSLVRSDEDLDNLRGDPRYRKALQIARARDRENDEAGD
ncbi:MAG: tetratricopeptide repeat protein, partial [Thermoanaerobaculia bacterium]